MDDRNTYPASLFREDLKHMTDQLLPFWKKAVDPVHGGVFTGFDQRGETLLHRDKFTWSQGRFLWLWSRLADFCSRGLLPERADRYLEQSRAAYEFLSRNAFLPDGSCRFLLTEDGRPKEMIPGQGHDISFYADCFVVMGFAEYARVSGDRTALQTAVRLYRHIRERLSRGGVRSEPYPMPAGVEAHGFAMIMLNTSQVLALSLERDPAASIDGLSAAETRTYGWAYARGILDRFCDDRHRIREALPSAGAGSVDEPSSLLLRHLNPGHTVESMWFVMEEAALRGDGEALERAGSALLQALELGWDETYGGLFRYVDLDGGEPRGEPMPGAERFETLIRETWDMKLWWPHSEALYSSLLAYALTGKETFASWHRRIREYTLRLFPGPSGMEWVQIRDREGRPSESTVALPVKDPYHILRNFLLMVELEASFTNSSQ